MPKKKKDPPAEESPKAAPVLAQFCNEEIVTENSNEARELYNKSRYGTLLEDGRVQLSFIEALYLAEKSKIKLVSLKKKEISFESLMKKANVCEPNLPARYRVFKDIRERGYIIKTALKFGADFRVYDRGVKPGEDHARWVVYAVREGSTLTWHDFAAKNRVAHSTRKRLLIGVVDEEGDVSYWESRWLRP